MNLDFFVSSPYIITILQNVINLLLYICIGSFVIILTYDFISFFYDLYQRSKANIKKGLLKEAFDNFISIIWLPLIAFIISGASWLIVYYYMYLLSKLFNFNISSLSDASDLLVGFLAVSPLYNLVFLIFGMLVIMFSFKNKVLCQIGILISFVGFIFPLLAVLLSLA